MNINKINSRDSKLNRRRHGMRVSGRSIFTLEEIKKKKADKIKKERLLKERIQQDESI